MFEDLRQQLKGLKFLTDKKEIINSLGNCLKKAMRHEGSFGIAFSGGLDSCLMAFLAKGTRLYSVGLHNSKDIAYADYASSLLKLPKPKVKELTVDEAELVIAKVARILKDSNTAVSPVNVGVGCVMYCVLEMAKKDNISTVMAGLGSEDLFAGYEWHTDYRNTYEPDDIQETLWRSFNDIDERDIRRETIISRHFGIKVITPFLDSDLVEYGMQIHPSLKVTPEEKKIILRETAMRLGLPHVLAFQKRRAAQYGSGFDKVLTKLAKKNKLAVSEFLKSL